MKTAVPNSTQHTENPPASSHSPVRQAPPLTSRSGRSAELAGLANGSPRVRAQLKLAAEMQSSARVKSTLDLENSANSSAAPVQRRLIPYPTRYAGPLRATHQAAVDSVMGELNDLVSTAYEQALQWTTLGQNADAYVRQWYGAAQGFAQNPDTEPSVIHARFGYAVESLACQGLNNTQRHGLTITTQVSHGHTRPDVVLSSGTTEVAWLDITSEASIGHIRGKDGAGWNTRPFVSEIVYPQLQLRALLNATADPYYQEFGGLIAGERQVELDVKEAQRTTLRNRFIALRDENNWTTGTGNADDKRRRTRDLFTIEAADEGVEEETRSMQNTRGALEGLGINPGPYGFNRGNIGSTTERLNQVIDAGSAEEIGTRKTQLRSATTRRILDELQGSALPAALIEGLEEDYLVDPGARNTALAAMALKGALQDLPELQAAHTHIQTMLDGRNARVAQLDREVQAHLAGPRTADHDTVIAWRRQARALVQTTGALSRVLQASDALHQYTVHRGIHPLLRPANITRWFQQLAADPPNAQIAQQVTQWIQQQNQPPPQPQPQPVVPVPQAGPQPQGGGGVEPMDTGE